jgi:hypothetical protein
VGFSSSALNGESSHRLRLIVAILDDASDHDALFVHFDGSTLRETNDEISKRLECKCQKNLRSSLTGVYHE